MTHFAVLLIIAAVGGVAVTLQGQLMGIMDRGLAKSIGEIAVDRVGKLATTWANIKNQ